MQGIYIIKNNINKKVYVGKSLDIEKRWQGHRYSLTTKTPNKKTVNRHLYHAVQKYGIDNFSFHIIEELIDIEDINERELLWMDTFDSCNREYGYNLRRDSSTKMTIHEETRELKRQISMGEKSRT